MLHSMMGKDFEGEVDIKLGGIGNSTVRSLGRANRTKSEFKSSNLTILLRLQVKANYPLRPRAGKKEEVAGELVVEITVAPTPLVPTKVRFRVQSMYCLDNLRLGGQQQR